MEHADAAIIGAGPAGSYLAEKLVREGISVALIDKKKEPGKYACSGLVSTRVSSLVNLDDSFIEHQVRGAVFHSPGTSFEISRKSAQAYALDRPAFDRHLLSIAKDAGAKGQFLGAPVTGVDISESDAICTLGDQKIASSVVVGADGAGSFLRGSLGLPGKTRLINGILAYTNEENHEPFVELFYGKSVAPGFFAWKIPRGKRTEYGLAANKNHIGYFRKFLASQGVALGKFYAHPIIFGEQKSCAKRAILVGDAAAQVKPFSGGGIIYGLISAGIAAKAIKKAFDREDFSQAFFEKEYEACWHKKLLSKIHAGIAIRETLDSLDNHELDALFEAIAGEKSSLEKFGDMDFL